VTESAAAGSFLDPAANISTETVDSSAVSSEFDKTFEYKADNSVLQGNQPVSLSDAYVSASKTSAEEIKVTSLDISGLCLCVDNLCLDSPRQQKKGNLPFDFNDTVYSANSSSDATVLGVKVNGGVSESAEVTDGLEDFACASTGDSTFVLADSAENSKVGTQSLEADGVGSPKEIPVVLEAAETFDSGLSSLDHSLTTLAGNNTSTARSDEKIEVVFNKIVEHRSNSQQATAESNKIQGEISFILESSKEEASKNCVVRRSENVQVCQNIVNERQEKHVVATEGFKKSDVPDEISQIEVEDINSTLVEVDTSTKTSFSTTLPVEETKSCLESKSSSDFDSAWTSTSHEVLSVEKKGSSEFTETAVHKKSEPGAAVPVISAEVPSLANLAAATFADFGAEDQKWPVQNEHKEFVKEVPTVLSELLEICSRQQKDLELGDEKFVDGTEFFVSSSKPGNLREEVDLPLPHRSIQSEFEENLLGQSVPGEFTEFDQTIADEAEKILQEIINASSECHKTGLRASNSRNSSITQQSDKLSGTEVMADSQGVSKSATTAVDENGVNPFVSKSSLCRSPPSSPRPSNQRISPCESPHTKSYVNTVKDSSCHDRSSGDTSSRFLSGSSSSPDRRICSSKVSKVLYFPDITQS
jgi:hypothetical protein